MPVKRIKNSLVALFLLFFISAFLNSCQGPKRITNSPITKYCRLYLSAPTTETNKDIDTEVAKITSQLNGFVDSIYRRQKGKGKYDPAYRYTLGYRINTVTIDGRILIEVQYYLIRSRAAQGAPMPPPPAAPSPQALDETIEDTGHTPPPCPRPRPGIMTKYTVEGWDCD
jgi:hypothetical protein